MLKQGRCLIAVFLIIFISITTSAQNILSRSISLEINRQRLDNVLEILSNKGDFYFSYNSRMVKKDSVITMSFRNKTVGDILNALFGSNYEFRESGNYIIIRRAPIRMTMITNKTVKEDNIYYLSGHVYDEQSGYTIHEASVYEKKTLAAALTDNDGYFKLKLKSGKTSALTLTVSKEFYEDTSILVEPKHNQELTITMMPVEKEADQVVIRPEDYLTPDSVKEKPATDTIQASVAATDSLKVERTGVGKFLLSAKQKVQTINLKKFFTTRPFQVSLIPWTGTHGKMSGQVVNNFSLNIFGGYTAGTNGIEIGGLFNIDKKEVKYFQAAGLFNIVGGPMKGLQLAGIQNTVLDSVRGMQAAGINNFVKGKFKGLQLGGIYNHVTDTLTGMQVAGIANFTQKRTKGLQIAGIANVSNKEMDGVQIAGIINYTRKLKGVQIGLINIADSSDGYSIGLFNFVLHGYHKLSISANEITDLNVAFKTGNSKFYSILMAGMNTSDKNRVYSAGYGLGSELMLNKKKTLSINPELSTETLYLGSWKYTNLLNKLRVNLNVSLGKYVSLYAGPSYSVYVSNQKAGYAGYRYPLPPSGYKTTSFGRNVTGWLGWNVGINFF